MKLMISLLTIRYVSGIRDAGQAPGRTCSLSWEDRLSCSYPGNEVGHGLYRAASWNLDY
jgi:hypothetical protein